MRAVPRKWEERPMLPGTAGHTAGLCSPQARKIRPRSATPSRRPAARYRLLVSARLRWRGPAGLEMAFCGPLCLGRHAGLARAFASTGSG